MPAIAAAWGTLRASLDQHFTFAKIKNVVGLAGLDLTLLAHLQQKPERGATKDQLLSAIDGSIGQLDPEARARFVVLVAEEMLTREPALQSRLTDQLARHGWGLVDHHLIPLELFDPTALAELPDVPRTDLVKAVQRFRDGNLGGTISAACGAVDAAVASVLGEHGRSFQEGCNRARATVDLDGPLNGLGWDAETVKQFAGNFRGALNQGAFVMQTLRSRMGDVHGTKPVLKPLVFDALKWAELFVRTLTVH
ncbi:hypothetical protein BVER_03524 [Candidatus Burkholderia verschuerenii]|uniref:Abortive infection protein-like C-terminal domain-containing protein n=1 Tax=Candidatus Burkholderia verschuerenii TaxID=242163 RepID=A0A0L0M8G2_9BURK|nr:hypothetical protein [Candidatus Burkholderia verschuerenii]KND58561.1 hypothetical protein BVER_03524 [Candidatus Burkholderia verschuerenii]